MLRCQVKSGECWWTVRQARPSRIGSPAGTASIEIDLSCASAVKGTRTEIGKPSGPIQLSTPVSCSARKSMRLSQAGGACGSLP